MTTTLAVVLFCLGISQVLAKGYGPPRKGIFLPHKNGIYIPRINGRPPPFQNGGFRRGFPPPAPPPPPPPPPPGIRVFPGLPPPTNGGRPEILPFPNPGSPDIGLCEMFPAGEEPIPLTGMDRICFEGLNDGSLYCRRFSCPTLNGCDSPQISQSTNCLHCEDTCVYAGIFRRVGSTFMSVDGVNDCQCGPMNEVSCTDMMFTVNDFCQTTTQGNTILVDPNRFPDGPVANGPINNGIDFNGNGINGNGPIGNGINGNGPFVNGMNGNGLNGNGINGNGPNGNGINGNGPFVNGMNRNGLNGNGINGNGPNGNGINGNGPFVNGMNGNGPIGNGMNGNGPVGNGNIDGNGPIGNGIIEWGGFPDPGYPRKKYHDSYAPSPSYPGHNGPDNPNKYNKGSYQDNGISSYPDKYKPKYTPRPPPPKRKPEYRPAPYRPAPYRPQPPRYQGHGSTSRRPYQPSPYRRRHQSYNGNPSTKTKKRFKIRQTQMKRKTNGYRPYQNGPIPYDRFNPRPLPYRRVNDIPPPVRTQPIRTGSGRSGTSGKRRRSQY